MNPDDFDDLKKKYLRDANTMQWKIDNSRYESENDAFNAYHKRNDDEWDAYRNNPISRGYPYTSKGSTTKTDEIQEYIKKYTEIYEKEKVAKKKAEDTFESVPANDDRWNELKEMLADFNGTPMEKLAAIEKFVETH